MDYDKLFENIRAEAIANPEEHLSDEDLAGLIQKCKAELAVAGKYTPFEIHQLIQALRKTGFESMANAVTFLALSYAAASLANISLKREAVVTMTQALALIQQLEEEVARNR